MLFLPDVDNLADVHVVDPQFRELDGESGTSHLVPVPAGDTASQSSSIIRTGFRSISVGAISSQALSFWPPACSGVFLQLIIMIAVRNRVKALFIVHISFERS